MPIDHFELKLAVRVLSQITYRQITKTQLSNTASAREQQRLSIGAGADPDDVFVDVFVGDQWKDEFARYPCGDQIDRPIRDAALHVVAYGQSVKQREVVEALKTVLQIERA